MNRIQADICLFTVVVCWALEFTILSKEPAGLPALAIETMTCFIGFALLMLVFHKRITRNTNQKLCYKVLPLAILYLVYNMLYFESSRYLTPDVSELCTPIALLFVQLFLSYVLGKKQNWQKWLGGFLVVIGIFCSLDWSFPPLQTIGLYIILGHGFSWALFIVYMNRLARNYDSLTLTALMMGMVGVIGATCWSLFFPGTFLVLEYNKHFLASVFADAYFICIFANVLNIHTQRFSSPMDAVAIYSLEPTVLLLMSFALPSLVVETIEFKFANVISCIFVTTGVFVCSADWSLFKGKLYKARREEL